MLALESGRNYIKYCLNENIKYYNDICELFKQLPTFCSASTFAFCENLVMTEFMLMAATCFQNNSLQLHASTVKQFIVSENHPSDYQNNAQCTWIINNPGVELVIKVIQFLTETCCDRLSVSFGEINAWCNDWNIFQTIQFLENKRSAQVGYYFQINFL